MQAGSSLRTATVWALILAALAVVAPFALRGTACGHDLTFHMHSWMEVAQQWREGVPYPRWAANANYGSGEPRFIFYPPLSAMLGALLGTLLQLTRVPASWMYVPAAFIVCAVVLNGLAMHRLAGEWLDEPDATLAAVAYALNPYALLTIYARSAYPELLAAAFVPLIVLWIVRERPARQMLVPLALTIAGVWLTNIPAAIIATYSAALLLALVTASRRNSRVTLWGAASVALGFGLASLYIIPVIYQKRWIEVQQALTPGVRPFEGFLFTRIGEPEHDQFLHLLSWWAVAEIAVTILAAVGAREWRRSKPRLWWSLVTISTVSVVLMLPVANLAYRIIPELQFLQFPWRWMIVIGAAYAMFVAGAMGNFRGKAWLYTMAFAVLVGGANFALQPRCDPEDTPFMVSEVYKTGFGYRGNDEYVPPGGDNEQIKPDFPEFQLRGVNRTAVPASARASHVHWTTYHKQITVESPQPVAIVLRLMNYPEWRATVNGMRVTPETDDPTGRMLIGLPAGHNDIDVQFVRSPDRWLGDSASLASLIFLGGFWYVEKRRNA